MGKSGENKVDDAKNNTTLRLTSNFSANIYAKLPTDNNISLY